MAMSGFGDKGERSTAGRSPVHAVASAWLCDLSGPGRVPGHRGGVAKSPATSAQTHLGKQLVSPRGVRQPPRQVARWPGPDQVQACGAEAPARYGEIYRITTPFFIRNHVVP